MHRNISTHMYLLNIKWWNSWNSLPDDFIVKGSDFIHIDNSQFIRNEQNDGICEYQSENVCVYLCVCVCVFRLYPCVCVFFCFFLTITNLMQHGYKT